ncbi:hypothetical protein THICB3110272 [Thiomonas sp. CB3]|nr:hypothetical protein THICB3110272 [Thiomonas sp. CB3]
MAPCPLDQFDGMLSFDQMVGVVGLVGVFLTKRRRNQSEKHTSDGWKYSHQSPHSHQARPVHRICCAAPKVLPGSLPHG